MNNKQLLVSARRFIECCACCCTLKRNLHILHHCLQRFDSTVLTTVSWLALARTARDSCCDMSRTATEVPHGLLLAHLFLLVAAALSAVLVAACVLDMVHNPESPSLLVCPAAKNTNYHGSAAAVWSLVLQQLHACFQCTSKNGKCSFCLCHQLLTEGLCCGRCDRHMASTLLRASC